MGGGKGGARAAALPPPSPPPHHQARIEANFAALTAGPDANGDRDTVAIAKSVLGTGGEEKHSLGLRAHIFWEVVPS